MLTPQTPASRMASWKRASSSTHTSTSIGSRLTEVTALAVIAWSCPPVRVLRTVTPVANLPMARRKASTVGSSVAWLTPGHRQCRAAHAATRHR